MGDVPPFPDLPRSAAEAVLKRAIELQVRHGELVPGERLADIAADLGVEPVYLQRALRELRTERARSRQDVAEGEVRRVPPILLSMLYGVAAVYVLIISVAYFSPSSREEMSEALSQLQVQQRQYFAAHQRFAGTVSELPDYRASDAVLVEIDPDPDLRTGYRARARHRDSDQVCETGPDRRITCVR